MSWICPECGEDVVRQEPDFLTPAQRSEGLRPRYSHRDGTQLCPVVGSRGYEPAQPVRR